jgi:hypothetical protein
MMDYQIQPSSRRCAATGRELKPGEKVFCVLLEEGGKLVRKDFAAEAWPGPPADAFGFWVGRVIAPESKKRAPIDDELLLDCFLRLEGQTEASRIRFRYVVALLLMRRKRFRFEEAKKENGQELLCLRCTRTGARHQVLNPLLSDDETAAVQEEVFQALGWQ